MLKETVYTDIQEFAFYIFSVENYHPKKMKPEWKERWINALRSGEYSQGQNYLNIWETLRNKHFYCCLGVLIDLSGPDSWEVDEDILIGLGHQLHDNFDVDLNEDIEAIKQLIHEYDLSTEISTTSGSVELLQNDELEFFGLDNISHDFLIRMNDNGKTFNEIADWIEENI